MRIRRIHTGTRTAAVGVLAVIALTAGVVMFSHAPTASAASTCTDTVTWEGISGTLNTDTCGTPVQINAACLGALHSNEVSTPGDQFGIPAATYTSFAENCINDGGPSPTLYLDYEERGQWVQIATQGYGGGDGTFTSTWAAR
jgi:hypothetical protein